MKRTRTSDQPTQQPTSIPRRHDELWLDDGNIVLVAGDVAFRVYRGLLSAQSTVFEGMFASSNRVADELYDDCPVFRVSDSPTDLAHLLHIIMSAQNATNVSFP